MIIISCRYDKVSGHDTLCEIGYVLENDSIVSCVRDNFTWEYIVNKFPSRSLSPNRGEHRHIRNSTEMAMIINKDLKGHKVYSELMNYDYYGVDKLYQTLEVDMEFRIRDIKEICPEEQYNRYYESLSKTLSELGHEKGGNTAWAIKRALINSKTIN